MGKRTPGLGFVIIGGLILVGLFSPKKESGTVVPDPVRVETASAAVAPARAPYSDPMPAPMHPTAVRSVSTLGVSADPRPAMTVPTSEMAFASTRVKLRVEHSTNAAVLGTVERGSAVSVIGSSGPWRQVRIGSQTGWMHGDFLRATPPTVLVDEQPTPVKPQPVTRAAEMQRSRTSEERSRSGEPVRDPYVGSCDCPYDMMRNGRLCGGRSAYSRPGGRAPQCYF